MTITFPAGREGQWRADMTGSRNTAQVFKACAASIIDRYKGAQRAAIGPECAAGEEQPASERTETNVARRRGLDMTEEETIRL
jgi:hypothetical protein